VRARLVLVVRAQERVLAEAQLGDQAGGRVTHAHHAAVVNIDAADDQVVNAGHHLARHPQNPWWGLKHCLCQGQSDAAAEAILQGPLCDHVQPHCKKCKLSRTGDCNIDAYRHALPQTRMHGRMRGSENIVARVARPRGAPCSRCTRRRPQRSAAAARPGAARSSGPRTCSSARRRPPASSGGPR
jgi:hypothetical protein